MDKANLKRLLSWLERHEQQDEKRAHPEELVRQNEQFLKAFSRLAQSTIVPVLKEIKDVLAGKVESASIVRRRNAAGLRIKVDHWEVFERSVMFSGDPSTQTVRISHEGVGVGLLSEKLALRDVTPELVEKEALKFLRRLFGRERLHRSVRVAEGSNQRSNRKAAAVRKARLRAALKTRPDLDAEISNLERLGDSALWNAAQTRMPQPDSERMEELHRKQRLTGLSEAEGQELARLERQYDRVILVRSHSAFLLEQRGHDIRRLISSPESHRPAAGKARSLTPGG